MLDSHDFQTNLEISIDWRQETAAVTLKGELDMAEAPRLVGQFLGACGSRITDTKVDVSRVTFIDSFGLDALISIAAETWQRGGDFSLAGHSPQVARLLELTHCRWLIEVKNDHPRRVRVSDSDVWV